jgi:hypothetical protein
MAPSPASSGLTSTPTLSPTTSSDNSPAPSPGEETKGPTTSPTIAPTSAPTPDHDDTTTAAPTAASSDNAPVPHKKMSFLKIIGKTIAWLIIIALSVVAFGAIMSNRYRIYFFLRGVWYTILRMECTLFVMRKLRFNTSNVDTSLNTIIFDNEMTEGLLMREDNA